VIKPSLSVRAWFTQTKAPPAMSMPIEISRKMAPKTISTILPALIATPPLLGGILPPHTGQVNT
jgi:hypothetical protein